MVGYSEKNSAIAARSCRTPAEPHTQGPPSWGKVDESAKTIRDGTKEQHHQASIANDAVPSVGDSSDGATETMPIVS